MYQTIIFDVDGTLIDTEKAVLGSLQKMLHEDYGKNYDAEDLTFVLGIPGADSLPKFGIQDIAKANDRWNEYMKDFSPYIRVFNGIEELLMTLSNWKLNTGIVTSKTTEELRADFQPFGLSDSLRYTVCADDTARHKPHPEPLLKFLEVSGADPATAIYIGDTRYDSQCAKEAGVAFGLALWGCKQPESIRTDHVFQKPLDVLEWVTRA